MGKKKGRQCGQFSSKSKRAAHLTEIYKNAEGDSAKARCHRSESSPHHSTSPFYQTKEERNERVSVDFRHLRTLLQERRCEDRMSATLVNHPVPHHPNSEFWQKESKSSDVGWILSYNHIELKAGLGDPKGMGAIQCGTTKIIPSLQNLSARVLAPILRDYISAFGEEFVHENIGMLPSVTISEISASSENVTDDLAYVLGNHAHLEGLILNVAPFSSSKGEVGDKTTGRCRNRLTDKGLKRLIPQLICSKWDDDEEYTATVDDSKENKDTWENLESCHDNQMFSGCWKLRRLELRNHNTRSIENLTLLLERSPQITHLCLINSLNEITGPSLLFRSKGFTSPANTMSWQGCSIGGTLLDLLKNLEILDLSECKWLNYDILLNFLQIIKASTMKLPLKMISVAGCCPNLEKKVQILNELTCEKPLISTTCQKRF